MLEMNRLYNIEACAFLKQLDADSLDLLLTSPPYADVKRGTGKMQGKDEYTNIPPSDFVKWFDPIAREIYRTIKPTGSFVLNIDTLISDGQVDLYIFDLLLHLARVVGFKFLCDFAWVKSVVMPSGLAASYKRPRRGVEYCWLFGKTTDIKIDTREILMKYSEGMKSQIDDYSRRQTDRFVCLPSGHTYKAERIMQDHGGSSPMNYIFSAPVASNDAHVHEWKRLGLPVHPARFPETFAEYFIRMLTQEGDLVCDCFMGSGTTAAVAKKLGRNYIGCDLSEVFIRAANVRLDMISRVPNKATKTSISTLTEFG